MDAFEVLVQKLDRIIMESQESLGAGDAKDYPQYRETCGLIKGLWTARREITDLKSTMENSDE